MCQKVFCFSFFKLSAGECILEKSLFQIPYHDLWLSNHEEKGTLGKAFFRYFLNPLIFTVYIIYIYILFIYTYIHLHLHLCFVTKDKHQVNIQLVQLVRILHTTSRGNSSDHSKSTYK